MVVNDNTEFYTEEIPATLEHLGLDEVAYARRTEVEGQVAFAIHAADGNRIGLAPSLDLAHAAMRQHGLTPVGLQ